MQIFLLFHAGALGLSTAAGAGLAAGILLVLAVSIYLWPLLALMDLKFLQLLKNSGLLFLGQFPRSAAALAILAGYIGLMLWFFPLPLIPAFSGSSTAWTKSWPFPADSINSTGFPLIFALRRRSPSPGRQ